MLINCKIRWSMLMMKNCLENFLKKIGENYRKTLFLLVFLGIINVKKIVKILVFFLCF